MSLPCSSTLPAEKKRRENIGERPCGSRQQSGAQHVTAHSSAAGQRGAARGGNKAVAEGPRAAGKARGAARRHGPPTRPGSTRGKRPESGGAAVRGGSAKQLHPLFSLLLLLLSLLRCSAGFFFVVGGGGGFSVFVFLGFFVSFFFLNAQKQDVGAGSRRAAGGGDGCVRAAKRNRNKYRAERGGRQGSHLPAAGHFGGQPAACAGLSRGAAGREGGRERGGGHRGPPAPAMGPGVWKKQGAAGPAFLRFPPSPPGAAAAPGESHLGRGGHRGPSGVGAGPLT